MKSDLIQKALSNTRDTYIIESHPATVRASRIREGTYGEKPESPWSRFAGSAWGAVAISLLVAFGVLFAVIMAGRMGAGRINSTESPPHSLAGSDSGETWLPEDDSGIYLSANGASGTDVRHYLNDSYLLWETSTKTNPDGSVSSYDADGFGAFYQITDLLPSLEASPLVIPTDAHTLEIVVAQEGYNPPDAVRLFLASDVREFGNEAERISWDSDQSGNLDRLRDHGWTEFILVFSISYKTDTKEGEAEYPVYIVLETEEESGGTTPPPTGEPGIYLSANGASGTGVRHDLTKGYMLQTCIYTVKPNGMAEESVSAGPGALGQIADLIPSLEASPMVIPADAQALEIVVNREGYNLSDVKLFHAADIRTFGDAAEQVAWDGQKGDLAQLRANGWSEFFLFLTVNYKVDAKEITEEYPAYIVLETDPSEICPDPEAELLVSVSSVATCPQNGEKKPVRMLVYQSPKGIYLIMCDEQTKEVYTQSLFADRAALLYDSQGNGKWTLIQFQCIIESHADPTLRVHLSVIEPSGVLAAPDGEITWRLGFESQTFSLNGVKSQNALHEKTYIAAQKSLMTEMHEWETIAVAADTGSFFGHDTLPHSLTYAELEAFWKAHQIDDLWDIYAS